MRVIPINWTDLETAFERNSPDTESFLDTRTGEVVTVTEGAIDYAEQRGKVQAGGEAFVRIEPAASREQYKWMERFVAGVTDEPLVWCRSRKRPTFSVCSWPSPTTTRCSTGSTRWSRRAPVDTYARAMSTP